jgi:hypothetical protein
MDGLGFPLVAGVGAITRRKEPRLDHAVDPVGLMAAASLKAIEDCGVSVDELLFALDGIATTEMSIELRLPKGYGRLYQNAPRCLAERLGISPRINDEHLFRSQQGGHSPQFLVNEMCERIGKGELDCVLVAGAEALATFSQAMRQGFALPGVSGIVTTIDATGRKTTVDTAVARILAWGDRGRTSTPRVLGEEVALVTRHDAKHGLASPPNQVSSSYAHSCCHRVFPMSTTVCCLRTVCYLRASHPPLEAARRANAHVQCGRAFLGHEQAGGRERRAGMVPEGAPSE